MFEGRDKRRLDVAGLGIADVVTVDVDVRVGFGLEERAAVEAGIDFDHRDGLVVGVVAAVASFKSGVAVTRCGGVVAIFRTLHGGVLITPRSEGFLLDVTHPLLALKEFRRPHSKCRVAKSASAQLFQDGLRSS
ncbi:hypothetical protein [Natrialba chahannaoensis]|uniref:hypothetical protein n=1 Tax=Natrialba chahannaoensis TaxID=68911 RepID=UPI000677CF20|nr:hypothetical protein [Natrialba chahannaoensis]